MPLLLYSFRHTWGRFQDVRLRGVDSLLRSNEVLAVRRARSAALDLDTVRLSELVASVRSGLVARFYLPIGARRFVPVQSVCSNPTNMN